jgi:hypothetical protein
MTRRTIFITAGLLLALIVFSTASAAPKTNIHIEVMESFGGSADPFFATGPAVDDGLICASGTVDDTERIISGPPAGDFVRILAYKQFYCDAGGGFQARLMVNLDLSSGETTANWVIYGGSGDYAGIHGNGKLIGIPIVQGLSILDVYDGTVR